MPMRLERMNEFLLKPLLREFAGVDRAATLSFCRGPLPADRAIGWSQRPRRSLGQAKELALTSEETRVRYTFGNGSAVTVLRPNLLRGSAHRHVRFQEAAHPVDRALLQLLRLLPREHRDLGIRRQRGDIDRGL
jgi:hypothetical protein